MIAGNHELSFDTETLDECREYMEQVGEIENIDKEQSLNSISFASSEKLTWKL